MKDIMSTAIGCRLEPDLTVVVGGTVFQEYSQLVCSWSSRFDAALASGMEETQTKTFQFPDRHPDEWEWIKAYMAPRSSEIITADNVDMALSWFAELMARKGLEECDTFVASTVDAPATSTSKFSFGSGPAPIFWNSPELDATLTSLEKSITYSLPNSKAKCATFLSAFLDDSSRRSYNKPKPDEIGLVQRLILCVQNDAGCRETLWGSLQQHLPTCLRETPQEVLLKNELFHVIMFQALQLIPASGLAAQNGDPGGAPNGGLRFGNEPGARVGGGGFGEPGWRVGGGGGFGEPAQGGLFD